VCSHCGSEPSRRVSETGSGRARLELGEARLEAEVGELLLRPNSLYHFIGSLHSHSEGHLILSALVAWNVDGLDVALYNEALKIRRQFEAETARPP